MPGSSLGDHNNRLSRHIHMLCCLFSLSKALHRWEHGNTEECILLWVCCFRLDPHSRCCRSHTPSSVASLETISHKKKAAYQLIWSLIWFLPCSADPVGADLKINRGRWSTSNMEKGLLHTLSESGQYREADSGGQQHGPKHVWKSGLPFQKQSDGRPFVKICNDGQHAKHLVQQVKGTVMHTMTQQMDLFPKCTGFISHVCENSDMGPIFTTCNVPPPFRVFTLKCQDSCTDLGVG